jgi:hypothetical protein
MPTAAGDRSTAVLVRRFVALVVAALVAGCSSVRFGYDNADTLLFYKLDSYVDLTSAQAQLVRERVHALFAWHRSTQLPGYADFLQAAGHRIDGRITGADVYALNLEINRRLMATGERAAPDLAALALTLEPRQIDRLAHKLAEDDAKARHEASASGRRGTEQRVKHSVAHAEEWFGSVSPRQREFIRETLAERPDREETWIVEREQRRSDLLKVVRRIQAEHPPVETATAWVREYFGSLAEPPQPERRARMTEYRHENAEMIAGLVNAATPEQKIVLLRKLHGYADDFAALSSVRPARS